MSSMVRFLIRKRRLPTASFGRALPVSVRASSPRREQRCLVSSTRPVSVLSTIPAARQSDDSYSDLLKWTDTVLHPTKTPLGSLNPADVQDVFTACQVWLGCGPFEGNNADDGSKVVIPADIIPRHVDMVNRLLDRLLYEHKCNNTGLPLLGDNMNQLEEWMLYTCQAWLKVSASYPDAPMAVSKAKKLWYKLEQQTVLEFLSLVQAHARLVDSSRNRAIRFEACQNAANLLSITQHILPELDEEAVKQVKCAYQTSLKQTLELLSSADEECSLDESGPLTETASNILEQMEQLALISGWEDIRLQDEELDNVLDTLFLDQPDDGPPTQKTLSDFERQALHARILDRISQASSIADQDTVEGLISYWRENMSSLAITGGDKAAVVAQWWKPFAQTVTNYYLRIQDPAKSTRWMQIQEQMPKPDVIAQAMMVVGDKAKTTTGSDQEPLPQTSSNSFLELDTLERVYAENEDERIKQKINLMDIWLSKVQSPHVPWRATEILESLEAEPGVVLEASTYVTIVKLWTQNTSDLTSIRKAIDIAMRCPTFNAELMSEVLKLLSQHGGDRLAPTLGEKMVGIIQMHLDKIPNELVASIVDDASLLMLKSSRLRTFVQSLLNKNIPVSATMCERALGSFANDDYPEDVMRLLALLESKRGDGVELNFKCYEIATIRLLDMRGMSHPQSIEVMSRAFGLMGEGLVPVDPNETSNLLRRVVHAVDLTDEKIASAMLEDAESKLLTKKTHGTRESESGKSPIPLEFYKKCMSLFAMKRMFKKVEALFLRLKEHHSSGYLDLQPDKDTYKAYMLSLQLEKTASLDKRIALLEELIGLYEESNRESQQFKPDYEMFDTVIGGMRTRHKEIAGAKQQGVEKIESGTDPLEVNSRKCVEILEKMHSLGVVPNDASRPFVFNTAMWMVLSCKNTYMHFKVVNALRKQMGELGIQKNMVTIGLILQACALSRHSKYHKFKGVTVMLETLLEMRQTGEADSGVYTACFHAIFNAEVEPKKRATMDAIVAKVFECCCEDGMLTNYSRDTFLKKASPESIQRVYKNRLSFDKSEPEEWTRNARDDEYRRKQRMRVG